MQTLLYKIFIASYQSLKLMLHDKNLLRLLGFILMCYVNYSYGTKTNVSFTLEKAL